MPDFYDDLATMAEEPGNQNSDPEPNEAAQEGTAQGERDEGEAQPDQQGLEGEDLFDGATTEEEDFQDYTDDEPEELDPMGEEAQAEAEGEDGEDGEEDTGPIDVNKLAEKTGSFFNSQDDVAEHINNLQTKVDGYSQLEQIFQQDEATRNFVMAVAQGKSPTEAAAEHIPSVKSEAPDPKEDPEAYAEWKADQKVKEHLSQEEKQTLQQQQEAKQQMRKQAERAWQSFTERRDMTDDEAQAFAQKFAQVTQGDIRAGRVRPDMYDIVYRGLHFDRLMKQQVEQAKKEARNEVIQEVRSGNFGKGDGVPLLTGGSGSSEQATSDESSPMLGGPTKSNLHERF